MDSARGEIPPPKGDASGHQPSEEHVEGLTARPIWDVIDEPGLFPWATGLEESADVIIQEFEEKLARDQKMFASDSAWQNQVMGQGWSAIRLQRLGVWNSEVCAEFPKTYELLQSLKIPLAVRGVCFARQAPGSGVEPHSDGRNFILTSHLGIQVPEGTIYFHSSCAPVTSTIVMIYRILSAISFRRLLDEGWRRDSHVERGKANNA